ncbi:MAG: M24 family metallopeptidase, partial [Desulfarculus sp.]|nr:M24 family metallopeptidase [Desulfarculus sp.]
MILIKSAAEIEIMRAAGRVVGQVLETVSREVKPGVSTASLDRKAEEMARSLGAVPAFKGYRGYPYSL